MAWTFSDYVLMTGPSRLQRAREFLKELTDAVCYGVTSDGQALDPSQVAQLRDTVAREVAALEAASGGGFLRADIR